MKTVREDSVWLPERDSLAVSVAHRVVRALWEEGQLSLPVIYEEVCKLIWLTMMRINLDMGQLSKGEYDVCKMYVSAQQEHPHVLFSDPLRLYPSQIKIVLNELSKLHWLEMPCRSRLEFLLRLASYAADSESLAYSGDSQLPVSFFEELINLAPIASRRRTLLATASSEMQLAMMVEKLGIKSFVASGWNIRRMNDIARKLILSGYVKDWDGKVLASFESLEIDCERFDNCFVDCHCMPQLGNYFTGVGAFAGRFAVQLECLLRCHALLKRNGLLFVLVPLSLAASDRYRKWREEIERAFDLKATIRLPPLSSGRRCSEAIFVVFMRREEGVDIVRRPHDVFIGMRSSLTNDHNSDRQLMAKFNEFLTRYIRNNVG